MLVVGFQDFALQKQYCDELLGHYTEAWRDRQVYYQARQRAKSQNDLLVVILDSFDKCKMVLPRWAFGRTPKRPIYETTHRHHGQPSICFVSFQSGIYLDYFVGPLS